MTQNGLRGLRTTSTVHGTAHGVLPIVSVAHLPCVLPWLRCHRSSVG